MLEFFEFSKTYFFFAFWAIKVTAVFLVPMFLVEVFLPARKLHWSTVVFNMAYAPLFLAVSAMVRHPVEDLVRPWLPKNLIGLSFAEGSIWKSVLLFASYLAAFDFCYYWLHRAQHQWGFLWKYHQFHHADANVSVSTATRHHWMEETFRFFVIGIPLTMLFNLPATAPMWLGIFVGVYGFFLHWNVDLRLGMLTGVFCNPQYHRIHHSTKLEHYDKNFAVFFPFWDRVFGTQHMPDNKNIPETGVLSVRNPNGLAQLLPWVPKNV